MFLIEYVIEYIKVFIAFILPSFFLSFFKKQEALQWILIHSNTFAVIFIFLPLIDFSLPSYFLIKLQHNIETLYFEEQRRFSPRDYLLLSEILSNAAVVSVGLPVL